MNAELRERSEPAEGGGGSGRASEPRGARPPLLGRAIGLGAFALLIVGACSRSDLADLAPQPRYDDGQGPTTPADGAAGDASSPGTGGAAAGDAALPPPDAALPDAALPDAALPDAALPDAALPDAAFPHDAATDDATTGPVRPPPHPPGCTPSAETCNGEDDDCDGQVDEGIAAVPCPGGGDRYCVDGRLSACPQRCEACVPGSERVCFLSYCTYWATQTCTADGRSFGACREHHVPRECEEVGKRYKDSRQLEQCCIDHGYCCRDEYDLDHDGSRGDMLGSCDGVACTP